MNAKARWRVALALGMALGAASLGLLGVSLYYADLLADWRLPGLAALVAIASSVMFMTADRIKGRGT